MSEAGRRIGPYRLLSVLGRGAMGEVWRARDERLDRLVALKLLPHDQKSNAEGRARMLREAKAAASIPHKNVVTLYDIVSEDGEDVLVMELVEGKTLADHVAEHGPFEPAQALRVLTQICNALSVAHEKGVLHRDVKTANVMLMSDGNIKVLDFGLAKLRETLGAEPRPTTSKKLELSADVALDQTISSVDERELIGESADELLMTQAGQILGTPLYMSPEQFAGEPPTAKSEVFAVGVVAHELLAGAPPFVGSTFGELQVKVFNEPPEALPATVPKALSAAILRALEKDPDDRFEDMDSLGATLALVHAELTRPRRVAMWAAGVAIVALAAVVAVLLLRDGSKAAIGIDAAPERPGDRYVRQALTEHNLFYNQKAAASIRAAVREAPDHPIAYAYAILFPTESGNELDRMLSEAIRVQSRDDLSERDSILLKTAIAYAKSGPLSAREVLGKTKKLDGELTFWMAELAYRGRDYMTARAEFASALDVSDPSFAGRIYDHYSAVLTFLKEYAEAEAIGRRYAKAFSGEPDAIGVHATTLAGVGKLDEALAAAKEALRLYRGEDTIAGLAKVHALRDENDKARALYKRSAAMASDKRRPIRNAAVAYLAWMDGDDEAAQAAISDCLPGGPDDAIWERGPCLWVAGTIWPEKTDIAIAELTALAAAGTALRPAYGNPKYLANLLRARKLLFRGACKRPPEPSPTPLSPEQEAARKDLLTSSVGGDFYATYHIPHFAKYVECEQ